MLLSESLVVSDWNIHLILSIVLCSIPICPVCCLISSEGLLMTVYLFLTGFLAACNDST